MNALLKNFFLLSLAALLSACGGGTTENTLDPVVTGSRITIGGSVGDGPIVGASVSVKSRNGVVLATTTSDQQANYSLNVDTLPEHFPLILEATNGTDLVTGTSPDFILLSVIPDAQTARANLNPHSTAIVKTAMAMAGGLNAANLQRARQAVVEKLNFGLDTALAGDPIGLTVDSGNVAVVTHASEALAEMLRRTSNTLGGSESEDSILDALAADLSDGILDGLGAAGSNPRYSAVSQAIGLQVLIESMLHDLQVNGVAADAALDAAIQTVMANSNLTAIHDGSTLINIEMITQANAALAAILTIDNQDIYNRLRLAIQDLGSESSTQGLIDALATHGIDATISGSLDSSIGLVVAASNDQIIAFNTAANSVDSGPGANQAPVISGTPASSVAEGEAYSFTPSAADADGDSLTFSVSNPPAWASFDSASGTLSGTPGFSNAGDYANITISVSDGTASASLNPFTIRVGGTNRTPGISGNPSTSATEGQPYSFTPSAADADGDAISFSVANLPNWASFDGVTGTLSGTPSFTDAGVYANIVISVSDGSASASLNAFAISVQDINRPPSISGNPASSVAEGEAYSFTPSAADADGDSLTFSVSNPPAWASFDSASGTLSGTPGFSNAGDYANITISVSDGTASASLNPFTIRVGGTNRTPGISGNPSTSATEGQPYSFTPSAADADGDAISFSVANLPNWASFDGVTGTLSGTPSFTNAGVYANIVISVSDGSASASLNAFAISVQDINRPPSISGNPSTSVAEGAVYSFTPTTTDPDGDALGFSATNLPSWASINNSNGMLTGTPGVSDAGVYSNIVISVSDGSASASLNAFAINVQDINHPPSISGTPSTSLAEGAVYSFTPTTTDPDGDALSFSATNLPSWASINPSNGMLTGTPGVSDAGVYSNIAISVSDGKDSASLDPFNITVTDTPLPGAATLTSANLTGTSVVLAWNQTNAVPIGGYDIFVDGVDTGEQYRTPLLTATVPNMDPAVSHCFTVESRYTDTNQFIASNQLCTDAIVPVNNAPTISGVPNSSAAEGSAYSFTPSAVDADGDTLTFSISGKPVWASFNTTNGSLSGTPGYDDAGSYANIVIQVTDGPAAASLAAFSINVANTNRAPSISGSPAVSVSEGELYSFTPIAADADGDPLSFSAAGLPVWASLDVTTGRISGTPVATDVGLYQDIVISVTDGTAVTAMGPISIQVNAATTVSGFANLAWQIPTTRIDGSPLTLSEIAGYRVYMGPAIDNLTMVVDLNDGTATAHSVTGLATGTYHFSVTSYDTEGNESSFSNTAQKTIQ